MSPALPLPARGVIVAALFFISSPGSAQAVLQAHTIEPRAYGYQVGDVLQREVIIEVPAGLQLDEASLPRIGGRGQAIELRSLQLASEAAAGGQRQHLQLGYQVFLSPKEARTLEIAPFSLRYRPDAPAAQAAAQPAAPREQLLRIEAWPVTVAPLLPGVVSPRRGLGELQPDAEPALIDETPLQRRIRGWLVLATLAAAWVALWRWAWPAWQRRHQPFGLAWAQLRQLPDSADAQAWQAACRCLHRALDAQAGRVVFEATLPLWLAQAPAFAPLQADLQRFLRLSRQAFFEVPEAAASAPAAPEAAWLRRLSQRCSDAERGN